MSEPQYRLNEAKIDENTSLTALANSFGTDKGSVPPAGGVPLEYTYTYEKYIGPVRFNSLRFFEIGIDKGASTRMWRAYMPNATIFCSDIFWGQDISHPVISSTIESMAKNNIHFFYADQSSQKDWDKVFDTTGGDFDFVSEDGSHNERHMLFTLARFVSKMKQGGIYFMEDIMTPDCYPHWGYDNRIVHSVMTTFKDTQKLTTDLVSEEDARLIESKTKIIDVAVSPSGMHKMFVFKVL